MNLWYTLLLLFLQQVVAEDQIYNYVVLIADEGISDPIQRFIGTGNVVNDRWVLALDQVITPQAELVVITGQEVFIDNAKNKNKYRVINVWKQRNAAKPEQALTLLETVSNIEFDDLSISGTMFYHFTPKAHLSWNCELVTWNLDLRKRKWNQNRIPVNFEDNPTICKADTYQQSCVSPSNTKYLLNSCVDLGAPLICDESLEGINVAEGANQCNKPSAASVTKVYLFGENDSILRFLHGREHFNKKRANDNETTVASAVTEESTTLDEKKADSEEKSALLEPGDVSFYNDYLVESPNYEIQKMNMKPSDRDEYSEYLGNLLLRMREPCRGGKFNSSNIALSSRTMHCCLLLFSYLLLTVI